MEQNFAQSKDQAAESRRETSKITQRAAERLSVAEGRSQAAKAALAAETKQQSSSLRVEIDRTERDLTHLEDAVVDKLSALTSARCDKDWQAEQNEASRGEALQRFEMTRGHRENNCARTDAEIFRVSEEAHSAIESGRSATRAKLDELRQQRAEIEAQRIRAAQDREAQAKANIDDLAQRSHAEATSSEAYRHRAAMSVDRFGELLQAANSTAAAKAKLTEDFAEKKSNEFTRAKHQVQKITDAAVSGLFKESAMELDTARRHCSQVTAAHADDVALYARKAEQMQNESEARAREAERQVAAAEAERIRNFAGGRAAVQETEERLQGGREACSQEIDGVNRRLRELEEETRAKAAEILRQWAEGTEATEQAIRNSERRGHETLEELRAVVEDVRRDAQDRNEALQREGTGAVMQLEKRANKTLDATHAALEAARRADEEATAAALARLRELRPEPARIEEAADSRIAALLAQVDKDEEQLRRNADVRMAEAKAAVNAARSEEQRLTAETAEAWQKVRQACYQLRLMNLHDFAEDIVAGRFDKTVVAY